MPEQAATAVATQLFAQGSSLTLLAANGNRLEFTVTNEGVAPVWLGFGAAAVAQAGVKLQPSGFLYSSYTNTVFAGTVTAIATAGPSALLSVVELA